MSQAQVLEFGVGIDSWNKAFAKISSDAESINDKYNKLISEGFNEYEKALKAYKSSPQKIKINTSEASAKINELKSNLKLALKQKIKLDVKEALANVASNASAAVGGFYTLKKTFGSYVSAAADFESALQGIQNPLSLTKEQTAQYANTIKTLSQNTTTSTEELFKMSENLIANGVNANNLNKFVELSNKVKIGFGLSADEAAIFTGKLSQLGYKEQEVNELAGGIHNLGELLKISPSGLLKSTTKLAESGKQIGFSIKEVGALNATISSLGFNAEDSEKTVNKLFQAFSKGDSKAFERLGIDANDFQKALKKDAGATLEAFFKMLNTHNNVDKRSILNDLVGAKDSAALLALANNMKTYKKAKEQLNDKDSNANKLDGEVKAAQVGFNNQLAILKNNIHALSQNIGEAFLPAVTKVVNICSGGVRLLSNFASEHKNLTRLVVGAVSALVAFKSAMFSLQASKSVFKLLGGGIVDYTKMLKLSSLETLRFSFLQKGLKPSFASVKKSFISAGVGILHSIGKQINALKYLNLTAMHSSNSLSSMFKNVGKSAVTSIVSTSRALTLAVASNPIGLIITAIAAIGYVVYKNWDIVKSFCSGVVEGFKSAFEPLASTFLPIFETLKSAFGSVWSIVKNFFSSFGEQTTHTAEQLENAKNVGASFGEILANAFRIITLPVQGLIIIIKTLVEWIQKAWDFASSLIDKISGIKDEITGGFDKAKDFVKDGASSVWNFVKTGGGLWGDDDNKENKQVVENNHTENKTQKIQNLNTQIENNEKMHNTTNTKQQTIQDNKKVVIYVDKQSTAEELATKVQAQNYNFADF